MRAVVAVCRSDNGVVVILGNISRVDFTLSAIS